MQDISHSRSNNPKRQTLKLIAAIGAIYFVVYLLFSLFHFRERFMVDGGYMIFEMSNYKMYPGAQNRYIIWLLDLFPVISINLELPMKTVMLSWILNYLVFYVVCFYVVLLVCKDRFSAWMILFLILFLMGTVFYNIADEITPSAVMAVTLMSVFRRFGKIRNSRPFLALIVAMMFFTVFGHLLIPLSILMVFTYDLLTDGYKHLKDRKRFVLPAALFLFFLVLRLRSGMADGYEQEHIEVSWTTGLATLGTIKGSFFSEFIGFYSSVFTVMTFLLALAMINMVIQKRWTRIMVFIALSVIYLLLWYVTIYGRFGGLMLSHWFNVPIRWLFPFNFLVLYVFFTEVKEVLKKMPLILPAIFVLGSIYHFVYLHQIAWFADNTVEQYETLSSMHQGKDQSKFYLPDAAKCPFGKYHSVYTNSLVFSAMDGPENALQFVFAREDELELMLGLPDSVIYLTTELIIPISELNPVYYQIHTGEYQLLEQDFSTCPYEK